MVGFATDYLRWRKSVLMGLVCYNVQGSGRCVGTTPKPGAVWSSLAMFSRQSPMALQLKCKNPQH